MRIGIDFRVFQVGHQFRGIGQVAAQALGQLEARIPSDDEIVLFVDSNGPDITGRADALFPEGRARRIIMWQDPRFPRLAKLRGPSTDAREQQVSANCDAFIQFDFMLGIPASVPTLVVIYDQIPILLGDRFPTSYRPHLGSARAAGLPMKHAVYKAGTRMIYEKMLAGALSRAKTVLTISRHTATTTLDFASKAGLTGIDAKVESAHLGWDHADHTAAKPGLTTMTRYRMEG
ncbi:MAG: hypothetical protein JST73_04860, partial [Actinobacteria bacterium]|nr:hypothetical protein [Actinomycetota bacterium]